MKKLKTWSKIVLFVFLDFFEGKPFSPWENNQLAKNEFFPFCSILDAMGIMVFLNLDLDPDPQIRTVWYHWLTDPDSDPAPDPAFFVSSWQDDNKKIIFVFKVF